MFLLSTAIAQYIISICFSYKIGAVFLYYLLRQYFRNGIDKIKLQHEAGNPTLLVSCDYKDTGICQHPLLHDISITSETFKGYLASDNTDLLVNPEKIPNKNLAKSHSAILKTYLSQSITNKDDEDWYSNNRDVAQNV